MASTTRIWTKISTWMVKLYYYDTVNRNAEMVVSSVQIAKSFNNKKRAEDTGILVDTFQICSRRTDRTPDRALMASHLARSPSRFTPPSQTRSTRNASSHCIHKANRRRRSIRRPPKGKPPNRSSGSQLTKWIPAASGNLRGTRRSLRGETRQKDRSSAQRGGSGRKVALAESGRLAVVGSWD